MAKSLDAAGLVRALDAVAVEIVAAREHLCALDGAIGDGDHGVTMAMGWQAIVKAIDPLDPPTVGLTGICNAAAKAFLAATGGSAGPLYATAFMRAGAAVKDRTELDGAGMAVFLAAACEGIRSRGKASAGDKTMLDAWLPAVAAAEQSAAAGGDVPAVLDAAATAAEAGAKATKTMEARIGRASRLGDRALGNADPGATSSALTLRALSRAASAE